ncbi:hypothetical protein [Limnobacter sp.]|uniref:hypothetical protein n=1 Tax=Limnobacter sp. TaxID=2003368 RepID=UPI0035120649
MNGPCVVFSDYPIKQMGYSRFLKSLGEEPIALFDEYPSAHLKQFAHAGLVIFDMNIESAKESRYRKSLLKLFQHANILFMEEEQSDLHYQLIHNRDVCCLGKLADVGVMHGCIKDLLLRRKPLPAEMLKQAMGSDNQGTELV